MNKFRILFIFGLGMVTLPMFAVMFAYVWHMGSNHTRKSFLQKDCDVIYDTVEVKKTIVDTVRIKIYEKVPQIDTKRVEPQPTITKDTLKS